MESKLQTKRSHPWTRWFLAAEMFWRNTDYEILPPPHYIHTGLAWHGNAPFSPRSSCRQEMTQHSAQTRGTRRFPRNSQLMFPHFTTMESFFRSKRSHAAPSRSPLSFWGEIFIEQVRGYSWPSYESKEGQWRGSNMRDRCCSRSTLPCSHLTLSRCRSVGTRSSGYVFTIPSVSQRPYSHRTADQCRH